MDKIAITGIGGVGGYIGGWLADYYAGSREVEIFFVARGENERVIRESGLRVESTKRNFVAKPAKVTSDARELGEVDYLLVCTKGYHLDAAIEGMKPCIGAHTVIIPFLNGVDAAERIRALCPGTEVWDGCIYIVSQLGAPGVVKETGGVAQVLFGSESGSPERLKRFEKILRDASLDASLSPDIRRAMWEKFLFISTVATATTALNSPTGEILGEPSKRELLDQLLGELLALARKKGIPLAPESAEKVIRRLEGLPHGTTSSMQRDQVAGRPTEAGSLTGYVVEESGKLGVEVPAYRQLWAVIQGE